MPDYISLPDYVIFLDKSVFHMHIYSNVLCVANHMLDFNCIPATRCIS